MKLRSISTRLVSVILVTALIAAVWFGAWQRSSYDADRAIAAAAKANSNFAIAYEEYTGYALGELDQALRLLEREYGRKDARVPGAPGELSFGHALIRGLAMTDGTGATKIATGEAVFLDMNRRDDFALHRDRPGRALHIAPPERLAPGGEWRVAVSRRVERPGGAFAGIAVALVDPAHFIGFRGRVDLGPHAVVSLVTRDGIAIARTAGRKTTYGDDMRGGTLMRRVAGKSVGDFPGKGALDGIARAFSYRLMANYPLIVMVGTPYEELLAPEMERRRLYYLVAALMSAVLVLIGAGVTRALERQERDLESIESAQARHRESDARSEAITENLAGGIITTDEAGTVLSVNSATCSMYGRSADELVGRDISHLVHPSEYGHLAAVAAELNANEHEFREKDGREFLSVRKDGTTFEAEILFSSLTMGGVRSFIGIVHDVSDRKTMERTLRANEAQLRAIFDQGLVSVAHTNLEGQFVRVNSIGAELLGYTVDEMLALGYRDITHPEDLKEMHADRGSPRAHPESALKRNVTRRFIRKDGSIVWALTAVSLVRDDHGNPAYFLSMIHDITELKRIEEVKGEFISTVSHELRTPLTSIRGSLGLLAGGVAGALPQAARDLVLIAERNCERLIRLVNDILDIDKIESGKMRFDLREVALAPLIARAVESLDAFAVLYNVPLVASAPDAPILASVDPDRFIQVMTNLISNAVKFSPPGKPVEVALSLCRGGMASIEVRDRGPGIPKDFQARIFNRFSQANTSDARPKGGSGLGLSIAKAIVERLGGTIGFRTAPGEGTTFHVQLPTRPSVSSPTRTPDLAEA